MPEPRHGLTDREPAAVDRAVEPLGDRGEPFDVDQRGDRATAGVERAGHHQITLGQELPGAGVVALVGPAGEAALVEPELQVPLVVGVVDDDQAGHRPR